MCVWSLLRRSEATLVVIKISVEDRSVLVLLLQFVEVVAPPAFPGRRHLEQVEADNDELAQL